MMSTCGDGVMETQLLFQVDDGGSSPTSPLQLTVREISARSASQFNLRVHSRLPKIHDSNIMRNKHYVCYGAYYNNFCYAVGIWSTPVAANRMKDGDVVLELRRMAITDSSPKNTASRLLSVMTKLIRKKFPDIVRLVSYQDVDVHLGTIYKASNWRATAEVRGKSWTTQTRRRNVDQTVSNKIRWEYEL